MKTSGFTVKTLKAKAERLGATVEGGPVGRWYRYNIDSPAGKVWTCTGDTHCLVVEWLNGDEAFRNNAITDALERMEMGLSDCDNPECDYCHPEEDSHGH